MKNLLVTGAAGYIGSHTARQLVEAGHRVVALDNLSTGHRWAVPPQAVFAHGDIADQALVGRLLAAHQIDAALHFAGSVIVSESVANPAKYYRNNVLGSLNFIEACVRGGVRQLVFSSSAAVYGIPSAADAVASHASADAPARVTENAAEAPINPYGSSKLITEWTLRDLAAAHKHVDVDVQGQRKGGDFKFVALRYFNVAGARLDGSLGQATPHATHLIKAACEAACGARPGLSIFGDDYPTADGTCIRDYIHVEDLARAHLDALAHLSRGGANMTLNCGYGRGYSVREVITCVKMVSGVDFPVQIAPRRAGDPPALVADPTLIRQSFGWRPGHDDLPTICRTAYQWEQKLRAGEVGER